MVNRNVQKIIWFALAILGLGSGAMTLTIYKQSTLSVLAGTIQILGGIILLTVTYMAFKKKDESRSISNK
ncbi:hypothetical protein [Bacillus sp. AK128]